MQKLPWVASQKEKESGGHATLIVDREISVSNMSSHYGHRALSPVGDELSFRIFGSRLQLAWWWIGVNGGLR